MLHSSDVFAGVMKDAKRMCEAYGATLLPSHPLGFGSGQYLIGFFYNTPDNCLPVLWAESSDWTPCFKRFDKDDLLGIAGSEGARKYA
jgi:hypothetical protein